MSDQPRDIELKQAKFVHVVATLDEAAGTGEILYVNPSSVGVVTPSEVASQKVEFLLETSTGEELARIPAVLRPSTCSGASQSTPQLIQQDIPYHSGLHRIRMRLDGKDIAEYAASDRTQPQLNMNAGAAPNHRMALRSDAPAEADGVSYTIMARGSRGGQWQTLAVGKASPDLDVDENQFPDEEKIQLRVIRTTGFEDSIVSEQEIALVRD